MIKKNKNIYSLLEQQQSVNTKFFKMSVLNYFLKRKWLEVLLSFHIIDKNEYEERKNEACWPVANGSGPSLPLNSAVCAALTGKRLLPLRQLWK